MGPVADANRVHIFDTTLRDGEQSPGISLNTAEKVEIAQQLARLGVDVIEAGFPITSPGDFEAVQEISRRVEGPVICGLARTMSSEPRVNAPDPGREYELLFAAIDGINPGEVLVTDRRLLRLGRALRRGGYAPW